MHNARDAYEEALARHNAGDLEGSEAHSEDVALVTPAGTLGGRAAMRDYWDRQRSAFPDHHLTVDVRPIPTARRNVSTRRAR